MPAIYNRSLNPADYDFATNNIGFVKESKPGKDGDEDVMYRAYNLVERTVLGTRLKPGLTGGLVENPEVLEDGNYWIAREAKLFGNTKIEGEALLRSCEVTNSIIRDNVKIGIDKKDAKTYRLDSLYSEPVTVKIINSIIDPGDEFIAVEGTAYVKDCLVQGDCVVSDHVHLIECECKDVFLCDHAYAYKSKLADSGFDGSVQIMNSCVKESNLSGEVAVEDRTIVGATLKGQYYYNKHGREDKYEFVTDIVA